LTRGGTGTHVRSPERASRAAGRSAFSCSQRKTKSPDTPDESLSPSRITAPIHEGAGVLEAYQSSGSLADALTWVWTNSHSCFWQRETHPGRLMRGIGALETITDSQAQLAKSKMSLWPVLPSGI
jgi:hypothetical protein